MGSVVLKGPLPVRDVGKRIVEHGLRVRRLGPTRGRPGRLGNLVELTGRQIVKGLQVSRGPFHAQRVDGFVFSSAKVNQRDRSKAHRGLSSRD